MDALISSKLIEKKEIDISITRQQEAVVHQQLLPNTPVLKASVQLTAATQPVKLRALLEDEKVPTS